MTRIRHRTAQIIFALAFLSSLSSGAAKGGNSGTSHHWVVTVPVANMYSSASENTDVVSQAIFGSNVDMLERHHKWARIRTTDQYTGWMPIRDLRNLHAPYAASGHFVQVESLFANLYQETDVTQHRPVVTVPFETHLEVIEDTARDNDRWLEVRLPDGRMAWIQRSDIVRDLKPLSIEESIQLGKRFLGLPYLWGGRSSYGYDCSGFTQMLVRSRGINMPRDADLQAAWSGVTPVDRKDLQPGDLLFFGSSAAEITHTGMYIGGGDFIHDTTNGHPMVQISHLDDEPWTHILVACRRIK